MLLCKEIMTDNPIVCYSSTPVFLLAMIMQAENVGMIPVVRKDNKESILGIITDRDIVLRVVAEGLDGHYMTAEDIMTQNVITVAEESPIETAIAKMTEHKINRLIVVNRHELIVGIISSTDLADCNSLRYVTGRLLESISQRTVKNSAA